MTFQWCRWALWGTGRRAFEEAVYGGRSFFRELASADHRAGLGIHRKPTVLGATRRVGTDTADTVGW